jgi:hypothetical protein
MIWANSKIKSQQFCYHYLTTIVEPLDVYGRGCGFVVSASLSTMSLLAKLL